MTALGAAVFVLRGADRPGLASTVWFAIGVISVAAAVWGIRRYEPMRATAWWMLGGTLAVMAAGDTTFELAPRYSDIFYFAMFPLVGTGLVLMTRTSVVLRDRARLLDLLVFTCAAALLAWVFVGSPALRSTGLSPVDRSMLAVYTLGALLVLVITVRLVVASARSPSVLLLAAG